MARPSDKSGSRQVTVRPRLRTRSNGGAIVPLGSIVDFRNISGPDRVPRYNLLPSAQINGDIERGYSTGDAIRVIEQLADTVLPEGISFEWTGLAYQQKDAGNIGVVIFPLSVLLVFLTLAALYES